MRYQGEIHYAKSTYSTLYKHSLNVYTGVSHLLVDFILLGDPPEHTYLYGIPGALLMGGYFYGNAKGYGDIHQMAYLASSLCCVGALAGLSHQTTSRAGNALGREMYV